MQTKIPILTGSAKRRGGICSLPIQLWPVADRQAWQGACEPAVRLKRGGAASHLRPVTRNDLARRYGYFLDFVSRAGRLEPTALACAHVTPDHVAPYVVELRNRVSSVTVHGSISKLRRITQLMAPGRNLAWLVEIERELAAEMQPRSKYDRFVLGEVLIEDGLTLMVEADAAENLTQLARARMTRNGLMQALLACAPIRLKNFAALELGKSFVEVKGTWWVVLSALETKERRADERPVPQFLIEPINRYIAKYRPILARRGEASNALWLSSGDGRPMKQCSVAEAITQTAWLTVGVKVSPHLFRTSAASTAAIYGAAMPHLATALLHHTHPAVTAEHYNRATTMSAARAYAAITETYRGK
jgi:site-specific recombinase XerD